MTVKTEVNEVAPDTLAGMIGNPRVRDQISTAIASAKADQTRCDHCLLVGPGGVGKSLAASIIANEMGSGFKEILGENVKSPSDLNGLFLKAKDKDVIHIDEAHLLSCQETLYPIIDKRIVTIQAGKKIVSLPVADCTILLSTTHEFMLHDSLRTRMKVTLRYDYYKPEDLEKIVKERCRLLNWKYEMAILPEIAKRSKGLPRLALRLCQSARRVSRSVNDTTIRMKHLLRATELEGINEFGLDITEQKYLQQLSDGPVRLNCIATVLGLPSRTISEVTEAYLIRAGYVTKDEQGKRLLTDRGVEILDSIKG